MRAEQLIIVRDVHERHNTIGRKDIFITNMEEDETIESLYRLTKGFRNPSDKIDLAHVAPYDRVVVVPDLYPDMPLVLGEYVENLSPPKRYSGICRCGTVVTSDGFAVYCPNPRCSLTIYARLKRLAETVFFDPDATPNDVEFDISFNMMTSSQLSDLQTLHQPFLPIIHGQFWGDPGGSVESLLLSGRYGEISLATFLVKPLFQDFIDMVYPQYAGESVVYKSFHRFFVNMDEITEHRDVTNGRQNHLIAKFLYALGIDSLKSHHIPALLHHEQMLGLEYAPFLSYVFALTRTSELVNQVGLHPLEAQAIVQEVRMRRDELRDIFAYYSNDHLDIDNCFDFKSH
jgi:hypothetical protein